MSDTFTNVLATIKQEAVNRKTWDSSTKKIHEEPDMTHCNQYFRYLTQPQTEALQKGLTFCPTPGPSDKSLIWTDFKNFHRRLALRHHFYNDNQLLDNNDQELINFLAQMKICSKKHMHPSEIRVTWKPANTHISLNVFRQAFKTCLLNSKIEKRKQDNPRKEQRKGLTELCDNKQSVSVNGLCVS